MDSRVLWSDVDSFLGSVAFGPEDLAGLTVQKHEDWEEEDDWEEEEGEEGEDLSWGDDDEDFFDDDDDEDDDWED